MVDGSRETRREQQEAVARRWAQWLVRTREARNKRPIDLVEAAAAIGEKLTTGQLSNWESARNTASPESARLVAKLLDADPVEALRAAGHDDWADFATELRGGETGAAARPPVDEVLATLRTSDLPDHLKRKFEDEYAELVGPMIQATEAVRRRVAAELDQALKEQAVRRAEGSEGEAAQAN